MSGTWSISCTSLPACGWPVVIQHPASHQVRLWEGRIRDSAQSLLAMLEAELSPEVYAAALERGRALELDDVVVEILRG